MGNKEESEGEEVLHNNMQQPVEGSGGEGNVMWQLSFRCESLIFFCIFCT